MTLSPKQGVVGISTLWHFRLPLPIQMNIKVASSPRLSGIGMPSPILWSHLLKMQRIVLLGSLLWWELGTNSLITGPGEWLSFRRFTSKLSWSWSWLIYIQENGGRLVQRITCLVRYWARRGRLSQNFPTCCFMTHFRRGRFEGWKLLDFEINTNLIGLTVTIKLQHCPLYRHPLLWLWPAEDVHQQNLEQSIIGVCW